MALAALPAFALTAAATFQAGHVTPLREGWLTEHTRRSEPAIAGARGKIQRRHPGGREIDQSGGLVRNNQTVFSRLAAVLEAPDPEFAIVTP
jgi:hypothetical protein